MKHQSNFELGLESRSGPYNPENKQLPRTGGDELAAYADLEAAIKGRWKDEARGGFEDRAGGIPIQAFMDKLELFPPSEETSSIESHKAH